MRVVMIIPTSISEILNQNRGEQSVQAYILTVLRDTLSLTLENNNASDKSVEADEPSGTSNNSQQV